MRIVILIVLVIFGLAAVACTSETPSPVDTQTASPPTPDVPATVEASILATRVAETAIDATVEAKVAAALATSAPTPTPPAGSSASASAGGYHTCEVMGGGSVACWGSDFYGQASPPAGSFVSVSAGWDHTCGVRSDGSVACWGWNEAGRSTPPAGSFTSVSAGGFHTCGIRSDGSVACWGSDGDGRATSPAGSFTSVSAGSHHTCGVRSDGSVACWGSDGGGQATPPAGSFVSASAGGNHTCGLRSDGSVVCWGSNFLDGEATPPAGSFVSVSAGNQHTCGLRSDGSVDCWGSDEYGQATPPAGSFVSVSAGNLHTCGVRSDSSVDCWGSDEYGQAAPSESGTRPKPTPTPAPTPQATPPASSFSPTVIADGSDDHGNDIDEATSAAVGVDVEGVIDYERDSDYFSFQAVQGQSYQIDVALGSLDDSIVELYDSDGLFLDSNDDYSGSTASRLSWQASSSGELYVAVAAYGSGIGTYTLTVTLSTSSVLEGTDDHGGSAADATAVTVGESIEGTVNYLGDEDVFLFQVEAGAIYEIEVAPGTLADFDLGVYDEPDEWKARSFSPVLSVETHRNVWRSEYTGDSYLVVGFPEFELGPYTVRVARVTLAGNTSYDTDRDGLIEVSSLMQLNAVRWDLDGDGLPDSSSGIAGFAAAFPGALDGMGCPNSECSGYELITDLDFDTNGNGRADAGDDYWNDGEGWAPIGDDFEADFESSFNGGGYTISNLYIDRRGAQYVGLFGKTSWNGWNVWVGLNNNIRDLALVNVDVQGGTYTGGLVGSNGLVIAACSVTGVVRGSLRVGGLVGSNFSGRVIASYSAASVADGTDTGGLVGSNFGGTIIASYSIGSVSDYNGVSSFVEVGGLVGSNFADIGTTRDSYWDTQTSGQAESAGGEGKTTSELQSPTGYTGIYENWNLDLDEDGVGDDLWDFGDASQYPRLRHGS